MITTYLVQIKMIDKPFLDAVILKH